MTMCLATSLKLKKSTYDEIVYNSSNKTFATTNQTLKK